MTLTSLMSPTVFSTVGFVGSPKDLRCFESSSFHLVEFLPWLQPEPLSRRLITVGNFSLPSCVTVVTVLMYNCLAVSLSSCITAALLVCLTVVM